MARSKREYPERICANPLCEKPYIPNYRKQKYHNPQCGTNHRNDQRDEKDQTIYGEVKVLKRIDKILSKMYSRLYKEKISWLHKELLDYEQIDISYGLKQEVTVESKKQIRWYFCFGIEFHSDETHFIIHKRPKNEFSKNTK